MKPWLVKARAKKGIMKKTKPFKIRHSVPLVAAIETIMAAKTLKKGLARTLSAIAIHWNKEGNVFPSQTRLAEMTQIDRRTVVTHVRKLVEMGVIRSVRRPNIMVNGQQVRRSNIYIIVAESIGSLFDAAKQTLKAAAKKVAQKDHLASRKKDHTISLPNGKQGTDINTVKVNHSRVFLENRLKAIQSELEHLCKLSAETAYKAAVKRNQIARGEILSDDEIALRKVEAARNEHLRIKSARINDKVRTLETALMTWQRTKQGFTKAMHSELSKFHSLLSPMGRFLFNQFASV